jgi:hypothetical protein
VGVAAAQQSAAPSGPALEYHVVIDVATGRIQLQAQAWGRPEELRVWRSFRDPNASVRVLSASDGADSVAVRAVDHGSTTEFDLPTRNGTCTLNLQITARLGDFDDLRGVGIAPDRIRASTGTLLPVPTAFEHQLPKTTIAISGASTKPGFSVLTSFDLGGQGRPFSGVLVRKVGVLGGNLGTADFAVDGQTDRVAWIGPVGFDPRPVAGDIALIRSTVAAYFHVTATAPFTLLVSATRVEPGEFRISPLAGGLVVDMDAGGAWSDQLRLAVTTALVGGALDRLLWFGGKDEPEPAAAWFQRGVPRYLAGQILLSLGALSAEEYAVELNRFAAIVASSPHRNLATAALPSTWAGNQLAEARGALHAAWVDAQMLQASKGARGLQHVLNALAAGGSGSQLSLDAWTHAIAETVGEPNAAHAVETQITTGRDLRLPTGSFGPCFAAVSRSFAALQLGFDTAQAADGREVLLRIEPHSPAMRAGLQVGDEVLGFWSSALPRPMAHVNVRRQGQQTELAFVPEYKNAAGQGWQRRTGPPEATCAKHP